MTAKIPAPKEVRPLLTADGLKFWKTDLANSVAEGLLEHYAMACNAVAEYAWAVREIKRLQAEGKETYYTYNETGKAVIHPVRVIQERSRKGFADSMSKAGLRVGLLDQLQTATALEADPFADDDEDEV